MYRPALYTHDCDKCIYLGDYTDYQPSQRQITAVFDLYYCPQGGGLPTVIARYGSEGPDYTSGLAGAGVVPELAEAKKRAQERGLL